METQAPAAVETPTAAVPATLDATQVKSVASEYIEKDMKLKGGEFLFYDPAELKVWKLKNPKIHEDVRNQDANVSVVCVDLVSGKGKTKTALDVDLFIVKGASGNVEVSDIKIHKVGRKERYTYDENNQIRPVPKKAKSRSKKKAAPKPAAIPGA
jgi:hypothetical protein